ncbi:helix-turn-helix transcriptional regulator [Streptomyces scabiei]|uniref:helix-turn-helix domain-containing protein n=1 Tax=Streptomyces scabiei TaxID=1930 RepID=UPI0033F725B4
MSRILRRSDSTMGRREQPIRPCSKSLHMLAAWLRAGREAAKLTYEQLAVHTPFSADTLARAASGGSVPRNLRVVLAYAFTCGLSETEAERLWKLARRDEARAAGVLSGQRGGRHISVVKDFADLHSAIVELYQSAGSPPVRSLDERIGGHGRLPHSTVSRVLRGQSRPNRRFVLAFAEAVNVRRSELAEWGKAWDRADRDRRNSRSRRVPQHQLTKHDPVTPRDLQLLMSDLEALASREPGIKLLVVPEADYTESYGSASRMTRELLVDQAQRQGDLSCPRCRKPSFGYDDCQGWRAELCTDCVAAPAPSGALSVPQPRGELLSSSARPRLPQRVPGQAWPPAGVPVSFAMLDAGMFDNAGPLPEVHCRLCQGFHEAEDGCWTGTGSSDAATAARADGPAVGGPDAEEEAAPGMRGLDTYLGSPGGVPRRGADGGIPSVVVRARTGYGVRGGGAGWPEGTLHHGSGLRLASAGQVVDRTARRTRVGTAEPRPVGRTSAREGTMSKIT